LGPPRPQDEHIARTSTCETIGQSATDEFETIGPLRVTVMGGIRYADDYQMTAMILGTRERPRNRQSHGGVDVAA
jgi:hypothetical protein